MCSTKGGENHETTTCQVDDERVRITRHDFTPGAETGWHRHEYPYAVVPLVDGVLRVVDTQGETLVPLAAGASYSRPAGVEHNVINAGEGLMAFVEIEFKG
jgi:quercetin dioxygenase-like cupin family protein